MKRKVIVNKSFGGYGWCGKGALAVLEKKGISDLQLILDTKIGKIEVTRDEFISADPVFMCWEIRVGDTAKIDCLYDFGREDAAAISVLEEFGSEYCSDICARLEIEEFDDMDGIFGYYIDEYDGMEEICERPHITEERVLRCSSVEECLDLLRIAGVICTA